ncbi:MAG: rhodanese-like domain-containing protein [Cocleimonas sp.]
MQEYIDFARNNFLIVAGFIGVLGFIIKSELSRLSRTYKQVGVNEAVLLLNKDNTVVLDVREDKEIQGGIIKGARHIKLGELTDKMGTVSKNKQDPVLIYCRSGSRSGHACQQLTKAGFEDVSNLAGGILAWESANLPVAKR